MSNVAGKTIRPRAVTFLARKSLLDSSNNFSYHSPSSLYCITSAPEASSAIDHSVVLPLRRPGHRLLADVYHGEEEAVGLNSEKRTRDRDVKERE